MSWGTSTLRPGKCPGWQLWEGSFAPPEKLLLLLPWHCSRTKAVHSQSPAPTGESKTLQLRSSSKSREGHSDLFKDLPCHGAP